MTINLKTAEERAAEIRAESAAREEAAAAAKAEKAEKQGNAPKDRGKQEDPDYVDYKALAAAEEQRAAELKKQVDDLQAELDPTFRPKNKGPEVPHVVLTELLNRHDNAEDALAALHDAIRSMREQPGLNEKPRVEWPSDLSHLTESQRARTLAEMEAGRQASERAAKQYERTKEIRRTMAAKEEANRDELAILKEKLAKAQEQIAVLRHNPSVNEVFPTTDPKKVAVAGI